MEEAGDLFAHIITFDMMNIVPAIISDQLCTHEVGKLLLIQYPILFLVLAVGRKQFYCFHL